MIQYKICNTSFEQRYRKNFTDLNFNSLNAFFFQSVFLLFIK